MDPSEKSQPATEPYETEVKEKYETSWSSASSSSASLRSIKREESPDSQNDHTIAFADLEPTASRSIQPPPRSHSDLFDPEYEVKWEENDVENPKTCVLYSSAYTSGISGAHSMTADLDVTNSTVSLLGLTTYLFGMAAGSMIWAPLSEMFGRRPVYISTLFAFMFFIFPCAIANDIAAVLVCRFFAAMVGCSVVSNSPGTINDVSTDKHRAFTFSMWCLGLMNGPVIGPLVGGFVFDNLGWRWIHWLTLILAGVSFILMATVPETYGPTLLRRRAEKMRKETGDDQWWSKHDEKRAFLPLLGASLWRPIYLTATEPILWFWDLYILIVYSMNYLTFVIYPRVFEGLRGWSTGHTGLAYLGIGVGNVLVIVCEPLLRKMVQRRKLDVNGKPTPESPVFIVCIGAILVPIGGLMFAWTCTPNVHYIWPILSGIPFGAGTTATFIYGSNYIGRSYGMYAASAMAGNVLTRTIAGGTLPLAGPAMYNALGPHWQDKLESLLLSAQTNQFLYQARAKTRLVSMADGKPKRSLFKRPTWASAAPAAASASPDPTSKPQEATDLFSHSNTFNELVEDRQRQRQRKKSDKDVLRRSQTTETKDEESRVGKRRRISDEDGAELSTSTKSKVPERKESVQASAGSESFAIAPTPQKQRPRQEAVIELLDDSDEDEPLSHSNPTGSNFPSNTTSLEPTPAAEDPDADLDAVYYSDPEMREYARQAREKRRREERERSEMGAHDPTVKLLITSPLPGTGPLIVSRKLSQDLQVVREAWLSKQSLEPSIASRIFFIFKLRRVYDVTTVRSLGIKVDSFGRIVTNGPFANTDDEHAEKIHIEAVTEEAWQELKDKKAAASKPKKYLSNAAGADGRDGSAEGTPAVDGEAAVEEPLIKITLKAKGHSDIKIKVRPSTTFVKMINAARRSFRLDAERKVFLEFDGERLEPPEGLVKDTDISDMDCIDVHIK
ncbi:MFS general substrate transporter [Aureobasidium subglaciale]|nr:MFS general substrate transporter [Aureobasidium subglaciale]